MRNASPGRVQSPGGGGVLDLKKHGNVHFKKKVLDPALDFPPARVTQKKGRRCALFPSLQNSTRSRACKVKIEGCTGCTPALGSMKLQVNLVKPISCARASPNFWGAFQSAANFLMRAVATLCRLASFDIWCWRKEAKLIPGYQFTSHQ